MVKKAINHYLFNLKLFSWFYIAKLHLSYYIPEVDNNILCGCCAQNYLVGVVAMGLGMIGMQHNCTLTLCTITL